ncbi:MAG: hypothetical protein LCH38_13865 [Proteobacteria bacterium]|nr:hypothetical protein [Pseudomonadota bacterium]
MPRLLRIAFVTFLATGALTACGKRGHLEPPPAQKADSGEANAGDRPAQTKLGGAKRTPITPPKRDLIIDGILE